MPNKLVTNVLQCLLLCLSCYYALPTYAQQQAQATAQERASTIWQNLQQQEAAVDSFEQIMDNQAQAKFTSALSRYSKKLEQASVPKQLEEFHRYVEVLVTEKDSTSLNQLVDIACAELQNDNSIWEGAVYFAMGALEQSRERYEDAIVYYEFAIEVYLGEGLPLLLFDAVDRQTDLTFDLKEDYERTAQQWHLVIDRLQALLLKVPTSEKEKVLGMLARAHHNYRASLYNMGNSFAINGDFYKGYETLLDLISAINSSKEYYDNDRWLAQAMRRLGYLDIRFNDHTKALEKYQLALDKYLALKDTIGIANTYLQLGRIYFYFQETGQSRLYKKKAARLYEATGDTLRAVKLFLLGSDSSELQQHLQRAEAYCLSHELDDELITVWYNYGLWMEHFGHTEEAFRYAEKIIKHSSIESFKLYPQYRWAQSTRLWYWSEQKEHAKVLKCGYPALTNTQESKDIWREIKVHDYLAKAHTALNQPTEATQHLRTMLILRDTLYERANNKDFIRIQVEYEYEQEKRRIELKNEQERQLIQAELKQQRLVSAFVAVALLLLSGLLLAIYRNYRDKAKAARILEMQKQQLVLSNQKLDRFAHSISHDILSNIDLLLSTGNILVEPHHNPSSLQHYYRQSKQTLSSTKDYCLQLLKSARERDGQATQEADTNSVLQQALEHNKLALDTYAPKVTYDALPPLPISEGDLLQVFQNLLSNAIAFAGPQPDGRIAIRTENTPSEIRIGVLDNGPGIPEDQLESVFEQGVSFKQGGNGQGLAFVRDIVESYGGRVWAERSALGGAAIWIAI